jgi:hypothetical protein
MWRGRKPHALKFRVVICRETKLVCSKQALFFNMPLKYFQNNLVRQVACMDNRMIGRKSWRTSGPLTHFGKAITFDSFQNFGKWGSRKQWLNKCVRCATGLLEKCLRHLFRIRSSPEAFLSFNEFTNSCLSQVLTFPNVVSSTDASRARTLVSTCCSWLSSHRSWDANCLPNNPQLHWLFRSSNMLLLIPGAGGFEYLHRSPASRRRRRKGNQLPGGIHGPPCSWRI